MAAGHRREETLCTTQVPVLATVGPAAALVVQVTAPLQGMSGHLQASVAKEPTLFSAHMGPVPSRVPV